MHGKCSCNCSDAHQGREVDPNSGVDVAGDGEADARRRFISHTCGKSVPEAEHQIGEIVGYSFKAKPCRCRTWYCKNEWCLKASGRVLMHRLIPVLETFKGMLMVTLTVDPKLFASPLEAFEFLKRRRCVAKLLDKLYHKGHLRSKRFFYVIEWQMGKDDKPGTEMPHFHVLVESEFINFRVLANEWNKFRPKSAPAVADNSPGFGHVNIRKRPFASPLHAARYACKYLTKPPAKGNPLWVQNYRGQIKRFSTSRRLLTSDQEPIPPRERKPVHDDECPCDRCTFNRSRRKTVGERAARCAQTTMLLRIPLHFGEGGELREGRPSFEARIAVPFADARQQVGADREDSSALEVSHHEWEAILQLAPSRRDSYAAVILPNDHPLAGGAWRSGRPAA